MGRVKDNRERNADRMFFSVLAHYVKKVEFMSIQNVTEDYLFGLKAFLFGSFGWVAMLTENFIKKSG